MPLVNQEHLRSGTPSQTGYYIKTYSCPSHWESSNSGVWKDPIPISALFYYFIILFFHILSFTTLSFFSCSRVGEASRTTHYLVLSARVHRRACLPSTLRIRLPSTVFVFFFPFLRSYHLSLSSYPAIPISLPGNLVLSELDNLNPRTYSTF